MAKYDFRASYPGPDGAHLGCLTAYTLSRNEADRKGRRGRGKTATRAAPDRDVTARKVLAIQGHVQRHPYDGVQVARLAKLEAGR